MQTANEIPDPTIHDLHSTTLEAFLVAIEKQMDSCASDDTDLTGLYRLFCNVETTKAAAIERETGA